MQSAGGGKDSRPGDVSRAQGRVAVAITVVVVPMHVADVRAHLEKPGRGRKVAMDVGVGDIEAHADAGVVENLKKFLEDAPVLFPLIFQADDQAGMRSKGGSPKGGVALDDVVAVTGRCDEGIETEVEDDLGATEEGCGMEVTLDAGTRGHGNVLILAVDSEVEKGAVKDPVAGE